MHDEIIEKQFDEYTNLVYQILSPRDYEKIKGKLTQLKQIFDDVSSARNRGLLLLKLDQTRVLVEELDAFKDQETFENPENMEQSIKQVKSLA